MAHIDEGGQGRGKEQAWVRAHCLPDAVPVVYVLLIPLSNPLGASSDLKFTDKTHE